MECYLNTKLNCIIKIGEFNDVINWQYLEIDNIEDINELIKELKYIKKLMSNKGKL